MHVYTKIEFVTNQAHVGDVIFVVLNSFIIIINIIYFKLQWNSFF